VGPKMKRIEVYRLLQHDWEANLSPQIAALHSESDAGSWNAFP